MRVLGIAGSLRRRSFNRALLAAAVELAPDSVQLDVFDLAAVPLYNADVDTDDERPAAVTNLKRQIGAADALLLSTPEYNHGISGVLKNALDWASRPMGRSPLVGKSAAIMGAAPGVIGSARAQQDLKLVLLSVHALLMPHAGVVLSQAREKFDSERKLVHQGTREFLAAFLADLEHWTRRVSQVGD